MTIKTFVYGKILCNFEKPSIILFFPKKRQAKCKEIKAHSQQIRDCDFSSDSRYILSCSNDKTIKIWNFSTNKFIYSFSGHSNWVRSAKFSPDVRVIASASDDKTVRLWDIASQAQVSLFSDHNDKVSSAKFHPDGTLLASASADGKIKLWDLRSNSLIQHYEANENTSVNEIVFHPSGKFLGSVSDDKSVKIWDLREGRLAYTLFSHEDACKSIAFSQDGSYFATAGSDRLIFVWQSNFFETNSQENTNIRATTLVKPCATPDVEPIERSYSPSLPLNEIEEAKVEEEYYFSERETRENRLKEALSGHLEKIVFQLGQVTENIQRLDEKISRNEEILQVLLNDERIKPFLEEKNNIFKESNENIKVWESIKGDIEEKKQKMGQKIQNIFSVGALATTGMLKEQS